MPLTLISRLKNVIVSLKKSQIRYLKQNGINRSKFMRQAIEAHQARKWDYIFIEDDEGDDQD